ncbi:COG4315 family predicted lipoprotein [Glycomyces buryatensis]|uniref:Lipoprotein n=1 Tax=Glycomyces buryatensis TaxID=2570927 RepID=A0A4S8PZ37_9ACTN|nr:hypothetical protein [Glycomyces buryatensis]THV33519.1 hypothetical protein FAB82_25620 [Glycomyces buryatensis]
MGRTLKIRGVFAATATGILLGASALAGCDGTDTGGGGYGRTDGGTSEAVDAATLSVADSSLGPIVVDGAGMSLYLFTADTAGTSTCYDTCESQWPPLLTEGDPAIEGDDLDDGLVGTTGRNDGKTQVTYGGHPLYYWASDVAPGDVGGQNVNDAWFVLDADGNAVSG